MNTFQKTTQTGKAVINKTSKLPEFTRDINQRMKAVCKELNIPTKFVKGRLIIEYTHEQRWNMIKATTKISKLNY